jgi:WD40 repeat protein/serine/threonine protein kinase
MSNDSENAKSIFMAAIEKYSPDQWPAFLDGACGDDQVLRGRVEKLLNAHVDMGSIHNSAQAVILDRPITENPGTQIGPYKLLQRIGEGGMGVVYMAEQTEPVERRVALKIIKPGMDTRQVIGRFEAERHALAMMDHPNIARVLDAGTTETGRPYFVMELVKGVPITQYCDEHHLTAQQRLELFVPVCHAVQHAHQKGIIHRDIKPTNVLVAEYDDRPVPKIIDFGVAKAVQRRLTERTVFTQFGQVVGTIDYMSPEQAKLNQLDVDTRSDVYSLGVLLYELLTGETPFDGRRLRAAAFDELLRIIREEDPPKPSTRLSSSESLPSIAANRDIEPKKLSTLVRGELDWIVMKALEKDRNRRYETANAFAADVLHYLADEPVVACPPSTAYRFRKFAQRNRSLLLTVVMVGLILLVASLVSTWQAVRAMQARDDAQQAERETQQERSTAQKCADEATAARAEAEGQRDTAERALYAASMQVAQHDWLSGAAGRLERLLDSQLPPPGRPDFRGWEWYYLFSLCHSERLALPCQHHFAWSPDGKSLATADFVCGINIWDVPSGERTGHFKGGAAASTCIAWSPDAKHIAAGTDRGTIVIWEVESEVPVQRLMGQGGAVPLIGWCPDGDRLASTEGDATIWIWDWRTGETLSSLVGPVAPVTCMDWCPDGRKLVAVFGSLQSHQLKIWDSASDREIDGWPIGDGTQARFSQDGNRLAWGEFPVRVTDLNNSRIVSVAEGAGRSFTWSPGGERMASSSRGGSIGIWDAARRVEPETIPRSSASLPRGGAASSADLGSIAAHINWTDSITWSPKGELVAVECRDDRAVRVWDAAPPPAALPSDAPRWTWIEFSPDEKRLLIGAQHAPLRVYDLESRQVAVLDAGQPDWLRRATWSPDGKRIATSARVAQGPSIVLICDAMAGQRVLPPIQCGGEPRALAWNPDGTILAVGVKRDVERLTYRGQVKLFSASTGEELAASDCVDAQARDGTGESVAWSPDGKRLAVAGVPLRVFDSALHPQPFAAIRGNCLDWSPDGRQLAAGSKWGAITIVDAAIGAPLHVLEGHGYVDAVHWHPWMPRIASGGRDGMVRIWDSSTGQEVCEFEARSGIVRDLDWSPDGWRLAMSTYEGSVRIWDASPADQYLKRHEHLRVKAWRTIEDAWNPLRMDAMGKEFHDALDLLYQLRTLHPEDKRLQSEIQRVEWLRAKQLARAGQTDEAIAIFKKLAVELPDLGDYRLQLPGILFDAGRETQAIEMLQASVAKFPQRPEYHEELGYLYEHRAILHCLSGEVPGAVPILRRLAREFPERPGHRSQLVRQLTAQLPREKAAEIFQKLMQEFPDAPEYREALNWLRADRAARDFLRANDLSASAVAWNPNSKPFHSLMQDEDLFARIAELRPGDVNLWGQRGNYFALRSQWKRALPAYARSGWHFEHACELLLTGDEDGYRRLCLGLADSLGRAGKPPVELALACSLSPRSGVEPARLVECAGLAVSSGRNKFTLQSLAYARFRAGQFDEAVKLLQEAMALPDAMPKSQAAFPLALAYRGLGQEEESRNWYQIGVDKLERITPRNPDDPVSWAPGHWLGVNVWYREAKTVFESADSQTPKTEESVENEEIQESNKP